jgi:hypothetical protein
MALRFRFSGLILPVAVSAVVLARPTAAPEVQAADKSIFVTVVDDVGKPVTGLAATDFGIREDNVIREVTGAKAATEPMSVVLLADTTSSVGENVRDIRAGATAFVRGLLGASPESQIQLSEFQGASTVRVKFTPKLPDLEKAISRLFPQPDTASVLLEALVDSRLWAISIQTGSNRNMTRDQILSGLAVNTGGMRQSIITASALENWMKVFAGCLTSQYVVTYKRPDATPAKIVQVALRQGLGHKALASFAAPK